MGYRDTILLWKIVSHDKVERAIAYVIDSIDRGRTTAFKKKLKSVVYVTEIVCVCIYIYIYMYSQIRCVVIVFV